LDLASLDAVEVTPRVIKINWPVSGQTLPAFDEFGILPAIEIEADIAVPVRASDCGKCAGRRFQGCTKHLLESISPHWSIAHFDAGLEPFTAFTSPHQKP